jgi:tRNA(adenine34) deaminase
MTDDERFMMAALAEARQAFDAGEIPVGAVVVCKGQIIGRGHNLTEQLTDVTAHAEMLALTAAAQTLGGKYLPEATLYVTVEPCLMCAGAIGWAQVGRIVYGASDPKRGYAVMTSGSKSGPFHPKATVTAGVLAEECSELMKQFFAGRR